MANTPFSANDRKSDNQTDRNILTSDIWNELTPEELADIFCLIYLSGFDLNVTAQRLKALKTLAVLMNASEASFYLSDPGSRKVEKRNTISIGNRRSKTQRYIPFPLETLHESVSYTYESVDEKTDPQIFQFVELYAHTDQVIIQPHSHILAINLRIREDMLGFISLTRENNQPGFDEKDRFIVSIVAPYLTIAIRNAKVTRKYLYNINTFLNESPILRSILIFDLDLRLRHYDPKARERCMAIYAKSTRKGVEIVDDEIKVPNDIVQDCIALRKLINKDIMYLPASIQRFVSIKKNEMLKINTTVSWLHLGDLSYPFFVVSLKYTSELRETLEKFLKESFQLTKREIDVIECINRGLSNDDISRELWISRNTVETHLKNIFQKTQVRNRSDLSSLIQFT